MKTSIIIITLILFSLQGFCQDIVDWTEDFEGDVEGWTFHDCEYNLINNPRVDGEYALEVTATGDNPCFTYEFLPEHYGINSSGAGFIYHYSPQADENPEFHVTAFRDSDSDKEDYKTVIYTGWIYSFTNWNKNVIKLKDEFQEQGINDLCLKRLKIYFTDRVIVDSIQFTNIMSIPNPTYIFMR